MNEFNRNIIHLMYWTETNLGDLLSPYIIGRLSGKTIKHEVRFPYIGIKGKLKLLFRVFMLDRIAMKDLCASLSIFQRKNLVGVGSIISWGNQKSIVWGSGFMNHDETFAGGKIYAVRGKLTNDKLIKMGFTGCNVFGDPALLLPLLVPSAPKSNCNVAIIPHWSEFDFFQKAYGEQYRIIDIRTADVEGFIEELTSCEYILSSSLHGIIIAHAYGIPALWIKHGYIHTDGFKFYDYFSSVDIPFYDGVENWEIYLSENRWMRLFEEYKQYSVPRKDIGEIQRDLLRTAPFELAGEFQYVISGTSE